MKKKLHLNARIFWQSKGCFCIEIDGDRFYASTYERAVCMLVQILLRDEINYKLR